MRVIRDSRIAWTALTQRLLTGMVALSALALAACGGSGMGPNPNTSATPSVKACANCGTAMISLTDAPGDIVSYIVTIDSLTLTRSDGQVVQTVPKATQVDFAQLVNLSEILSDEQVPAGRYTSATLTLDYTNATIVVDTSNGDVTVPAADILDATTGAPLTGQVKVNLSLGSDDQLVITPGTISNLALDFNLAASNAVNLNASPITVTVTPTLTASLTPGSTKQIHVRGSLVSVSASGSDYVVNVAPFHDSDDAFGQFTVETTSSTNYLINGTSYTGSAGLAALAALPAGTMTAAYGTWDKSAKTFTASVVHAGSSVTGASGDSVLGTVLARSGDSVTVSNALLFTPLSMPSNNDMAGTGTDNTNQSSGDSMEFGFQHQVTVTVGSGTTVTEQGQSGTLPIADISVGQRARFTGTFSSSTGTGSTSSGGTLDATSGTVELLPTDGIGVLSASASGQITVNLQSLGFVQAGNLNFAGTGVTSGQDATASAYQISIPTSFSTTSLVTGLPLSFTGFVTPFGAAPPDFAASTVISYNQAHAQLLVSWATPGESMPFSMLTSSELLLSQATLQAGTTHVIRIDGASIDASALTGGLELVPSTSSSGDDDSSFAIVHVSSDTIDTFSTFGNFTAALTTDLGSAAALRVTAAGTYGSTGVLTVNSVVVALDN